MCSSAGAVFLRSAARALLGLAQTHCAAASRTTSNRSVGYSLKIKLRGAGGVSSVMLEKRTGLCLFMWACASDNICCSIGPVVQTCQMSQNFSPFGSSLVPRKLVPLRRPGHSSSGSDCPEKMQEMIRDRPCPGGSSHVTFSVTMGVSLHILNSLAGITNCRGVTIREPTCVRRNHLL